MAKLSPLTIVKQRNKSCMVSIINKPFETIVKNKISGEKRRRFKNNR